MIGEDKELTFVSLAVCAYLVGLQFEEVLERLLVLLSPLLGGFRRTTRHRSNPDLGEAISMKFLYSSVGECDRKVPRVAAVEHETVFG